MEIKKILLFIIITFYSGVLLAAEGMWIINKLDSTDWQKMKAMGMSISLNQIYDTENPSIKDAVVQFNGGCSGVMVSNQGLILTNHHCGYDAIQSQSSIENNYLKNGFVSQTIEEEIPIPGLYISYLIYSEEVTARILSSVQEISDENKRSLTIDSLIFLIQDSVNFNNPFIQAEVASYFDGNAYFLHIYENYTDVRLVFAPPSSIGKFGGDTDNWVWPRHTGDFCVFRVYAGKNNKPADFNAENIPYSPRYFVPVSIDGYKENDYAMVIGYPGRTDRYLSSRGILQRIEEDNEPRIQVRGIKQAIWDKAMKENEAIEIKYASKYAQSSNYWKYSIGMNQGIKRLNILEKREMLEKEFENWIAKNPNKNEIYGKSLPLIDKGYEAIEEQQRALTYLSETLLNGAEIISLAIDLSHFVPEYDPEKQDGHIQTVLVPYKNYSPALDQKVLVEMMHLARKNIPAKYLPDVFDEIDKKYKNNYDKYVTKLFKESIIPYPDKLSQLLTSKEKFERIGKDPVYQLAMSCQMSYFDIIADATSHMNDIAQGKRLFMAGLQEMKYPKKLSPDANFTMRLSYGKVGGYPPADAIWYDYYSTTQGIFEKYKKDDPEFHIQAEIMDLFRSKNFVPYENEAGNMNLCFISDNDITGGNSGSPVLDAKGRLIGLAFDGNWEAMTSDIMYEPEIQKTISVDIRYVMFIIDKWGKCARLVKEIYSN